jgi:disulfide bond formation protein DsbB
LNALQRRGLGPGCASALLLLAALAFQYIGGLEPCPICIWQRWPHVIAFLCMLLLIALPGRFWALVAGSAMAVNALIALYHTGIERSWWPGPDSCTGGDFGQVSSSELLDQIMATDVVLCDQVAWQMWGLSMASWNGLICLLLAGLWFRAYASSSASQ